MHLENPHHNQILDQAPLLKTFITPTHTIDDIDQRCLEAKRLVAQRSEEIINRVGKETWKTTVNNMTTVAQTFGVIERPTTEEGDRQTITLAGIITILGYEIGKVGEVDDITLFSQYIKEAGLEDGTFNKDILNIPNGDLILNQAIVVMLSSGFLLANNAFKDFIETLDF